MPRLTWPRLENLDTSKFHARRTAVDGLTFASQHEADRYAELRLLVKAGQIRQLELQPKFPLHVCVVGADGVCRSPVILAHYIADFAYEERSRDGASWSRVVEDAKGVRTPIYKLKKRWFEAQHRVPIREV